MTTVVLIRVNRNRIQAKAAILLVSHREDSRPHLVKSSSISMMNEAERNFWNLILPSDSKSLLSILWSFIFKALFFNQKLRKQVCSCCKLRNCI